MSRETRLVKNTFILSIGTFLPKLASFITLPILTVCLSKEQYGIYDLITVLVGLILPVATLQIHTAMFRFLIDHKDDYKYAKMLFSNAIAFVVPVSTIVLIALYFFLPIDNIEIRVWTCVYLFFDTIVCEVRQLSRGLFKNLDYSISAVISAVTKMILALVLVQFIKMELLGAIIALALSPIFSLIYLIFRIRVYELFDLHLLSKSTLKEMLAYSWPMVPNNMSGWVMNVSDRFVITACLGLAQNAIYAVANKMPSLLLLAQSTISMAWQENASIVSKDEDAAAYYTKMFSVMQRFYAGCLGLIIASTPVLFSLLIRGDYAESYIQMPILFLAFYFHCMSGFLGGIYIALKATKSVGITTFFAALCNIIIDLCLVNTIGLFAASVSTLVSYLFLQVYRMKNVRKLIDVQFNYLEFILIGGILVLECRLFYFDNIVTNIINILLGITVFFVLNREIIIGVLKKLLR